MLCLQSSMQSCILSSSSQMRVLICGDRNWSDRKAIRSWLCKLQDWGYDTVIEGEARGADTIARDEAGLLGMTVLKFPAEWSQYHRAAGAIRNKQMLDEGKPDLVVAFHRNMEQSKGTKLMLKLAKDAGVETLLESG